MSQPRQREIDALLQRGLSDLRGGRAVQGEAILRQTLAIDPAQPDALQLLGLAAKNGGRSAEAIALFRRSLAARPGQPNVLNNLATTLADGEAAEREALLAEALKLQPDYPDAALNLALLLIDQQRFADAAARLRASLEFRPGQPALLEALGIALRELGEEAAALAAASQAVALSPQRVTAWHNLGRARLAAGDLPGSAEAYRRALALKPDLAASIAGLSHVLRGLGRNEEAIGLLQGALARAPHDVDSLRNLGALLWELGRGDEALAAYRTAVERVGHPMLRIVHANELIQRRLYAEARTVLAAANAASPGLPQYFNAMARLAGSEGDHEEAAKLGQQALAQEPGLPLLSINLSDSLLRLGRPGDAIDLLAPVHAAQPFDQGVLARYTAALRQVDDPVYGRLVDLDRMTTVVQVEPPPGYDTDSFNAALAAYLRGVHTAKIQPLEQTLENGTQTFGNLFMIDRSPLVQAVKTQIAKAVQNFVDRLPDDASHPFFGRKRPATKFAGSWSVRLNRQGFHTNHMHPDGWLSSAYYVAVPDESAADAAGRPGWFKFGESNLALGGPDMPERFVQPQPGRLVLFPSYFWHGTVPFGLGAERLTVAFDAVPV